MCDFCCSLIVLQSSKLKSRLGLFGLPSVTSMSLQAGSQALIVNRLLEQRDTTHRPSEPGRMLQPALPVGPNWTPFELCGRVQLAQKVLTLGAPHSGSSVTALGKLAPAAAAQEWTETW